MRIRALDGNLPLWCSQDLPLVLPGVSPLPSLGDCWSVQNVSACTSPGDDYVAMSLSCPEIERLVCCLGH